MKTQTFNPSCGTHIDSAAVQATQLARQVHRVVRFQFNDVKLHAAPKKSATTLLWEYEMITGQKHEAYRSSKRGREDTEHRALEIERKQDAVTCLLRGLPGTLHGKNLNHMLGWLVHFTRDADDIDVDLDKAAGLTHGGLEWIAVLFEANGFIENEYTGQPDRIDSKEKQARYIAGQVIHCARRGMPPHPVLERFAAECLQMPEGKAQQ